MALGELMQPHDHRTLCTQLADDLSWLEEHCRNQPDLVVQAGQLRLAAALVRNAIGPMLDNQPPTPLHIAVVGGAGSGKSTVTNFLTGANAAEANPQAGFTRHPVAYVHGSNPLHWPAQIGFLGPLRKLAQPGPSNLDEDVYQIRRVAPASGYSLLNDFVVWDCPDMTTWAATGYVSRLIEVCGLADVIVFVASDERYNDEVPTQFLQLLLQAGKQVVICLTKMRESDAQAMSDHFRQAVLSKLPVTNAAVVTIPFLTAEELADPVKLAARYRVPLLNQVAVLGEPAVEARRRTVRAAVQFLASSCDSLLSVARTDLAALEIWRSIVETGRATFDSRYYNEYLLGEKLPRFDEAMVKLVDLLELPGVGEVMRWVRFPYTLLKSAFSKMIARPETPPIPEKPVLEAALQGWLDYLRSETLRRSGMHPLWAHLNKGFDGPLNDGAKMKFDERFHDFQLGIAGEVDQTSRAIYEDLKKNPGLLNTLRGGKLALDVAGIASSIAILPAGHLIWAAVAVPLAGSITQAMVEFFGKQYVENQREAARNRQQTLAQKTVSAPMAEWLLNWPISGGSSFERLQQVLRRIPESIQKIGKLV